MVQKSKGAFTMTLFSQEPPRRPFPSDRYTKTNPLRREFGLRKLAAPLPEPLASTLIQTWRHRPRYDGNEAIPSLHRPRHSQAELFDMAPARVGIFALIELEVARRVVEAPLASISRETRNTLLAAQGVYLQDLYAALERQVGERAALAEFQRLVRRVS
jgi:hypothetical protein